jgi:hypothetical protein
MNNEKLINLVLSEINEMSESNLIDLNNTYCESCNMSDNLIYSNDEEFFEMLNWSGLRVAQATFYGEYNYSHDWVTFNGYGNFQSYDYFTVEQLVELPQVIAEYICENYNDFSHLFSVNVDELINE